VRHLQERRVVVTALSSRARRLGSRPRRLGSRPGRLGSRPRRLVLPAVAAVVIALDQATKSWAQRGLVRDGLPVPHHLAGPLWLDLTYNGGAAFGLGRGVTPVVESVVVVIVVWLLLVSRRAAQSGSWLSAVGLGLLIGGAAGNLIDRFLRHNHGAVIDFIAALRIGSRDWWPVFNVADASIVVGVVLLAVAFARRPAPPASA
jgi:signal peptidase II